MGRVQNRLHYALVAREAQLVDAQRQDDRHREAPQQAEEAQQDGVLDHSATGRGGEEPLEPFQAHPLAAQIAAGRLEVPEGDLDAVHRNVLVHEGQHHRDQQQQVQLPVVRDAPPHGFPPRRRGLGGGNLCCLHSVHFFLFNGPERRFIYIGKPRLRRADQSRPPSLPMKSALANGEQLCCRYHLPAFVVRHVTFHIICQLMRVLPRRIDAMKRYTTIIYRITDTPCPCQPLNRIFLKFFCVPIFVSSNC